MKDCWAAKPLQSSAGKGSYSSLSATADDKIGALIEINEDVSQNKTGSKSIEFHQFHLAGVLNGAKEP